MHLFRWLKGKLFGGKIIHTVGSVDGEKAGMVGTALHVHVLEPAKTPGARAVTLEIVAKSFASYQMMPITLSADEAERLSDLVREAAQAARGAGSLI